MRLRLFDDTISLNINTETEDIILEFKWLNESEIKITDGRIEIKAPGQTFSAEVLTNARKEFSLSPFAMHRIIIQRLKEILCLK